MYVVVFTSMKTFALWAAPFSFNFEIFGLKLKNGLENLSGPSVSLSTTSLKKIPEFTVCFKEVFHIYRTPSANVQIKEVGKEKP